MNAWTSLTEAGPCPLEQSCMAMHGEPMPHGSPCHMEAQPPMGLKGDSGHIRFRGQIMRREDEAPKRLAGMHGGAWDSASSSTWSM